MSISLTINATSNDDLRSQMLALLGITLTPAEDAPAPKVTAPKAATKPVETKVEPVAEETKVEPEAVAEVVAGVVVDGDVTITYDDHIKPAVLKVSAKHGRPGVEKLLADFKVANAKEVPEAQWPELLAAVDALLK